jgi:hypothetical protein
VSTLDERPTAEPLVFEVSGWPSFPPGVLPNDSVDLDADDPCRVEGRSTRQCVGSRADGERCGAVPVTGTLLCSLHAGLLDSAQGGRARAEKARERRREAEEALGRRSLGTRAMIADVLHDRAEDVAKVVNALIDRAAAGDQRAQALLLPYIDQALGKPQERVEHTVPGSAEEIASASDESLRALVQRGREQRLRLVEHLDA